MTSSGTSLRATPPGPPVLVVAAPPGMIPRTPTGSHLPVHLLHVYAQDEYHGCIRNIMMLMDEEQQVTKHHWTFVDRGGATLYSKHFKE
jgi:hypothetical protein